MAYVQWNKRDGISITMIKCSNYDKMITGLSYQKKAS